MFTEYLSNVQIIFPRDIGGIAINNIEKYILNAIVMCPGFYTTKDHLLWGLPKDVNPEDVLKEMDNLELGGYLDIAGSFTSSSRVKLPREGEMKFPTH